MTYIKRDNKGQIIALSLVKTDECDELVEKDSEELSKALIKFSATDLNVVASDFEMIRVIEDVIDVLINKSLINVNDLPQSVQLKLLARKSFRKNGTFSTDSSELIQL